MAQRAIEQRHELLAAQFVQRISVAGGDLVERGGRCLIGCRGVVGGGARRAISLARWRATRRQMLRQMPSSQASKRVAVAQVVERAPGRQQRLLGDILGLVGGGAVASRQPRQPWPRRREQAIHIARQRGERGPLRLARRRFAGSRSGRGWPNGRMNSFWHGAHSLLQHTPICRASPPIPDTNFSSNFLSHIPHMRLVRMPHFLASPGIAWTDTQEAQNPSHGAPKPSYVHTPGAAQLNRSLFNCAAPCRCHVAARRIIPDTLPLLPTEHPRRRWETRLAGGSRPAPMFSRGYPLFLLVVLVVLEAEVGDLLLAHHPAQRVLELRLLDEEVVLRVEPWRRAAGS